jgi:hypothetical protein
MSIATLLNRRTGSPRRRIVAALASAAALASLALGASVSPAEASIIPCQVSGPNVYHASAGVLGTRASIFCIGATRTTVRVQWYRNGILVGGNWAGGGTSATTVAGTRCYRGAIYQPVAFVTASAPNAVPAARTVWGPYGRFCG